MLNLTSRETRARFNSIYSPGRRKYQTLHFSTTHSKTRQFTLSSSFWPKLKTTVAQEEVKFQNANVVTARGTGHPFRPPPGPQICPRGSTHTTHTYKHIHTHKHNTHIHTRTRAQVTTRPLDPNYPYLPGRSVPAHTRTHHTHAHSFASPRLASPRTHDTSRTHGTHDTSRTTRTETEIDFPVGLPPNLRYR